MLRAQLDAVNQANFTPVFRRPWQSSQRMPPKRHDGGIRADDRRGNAMSIMYHDGNRQLQDRFDSRRISDRLEEKLTRTAFSADDKAFIEGAAYFFLATA